MRRPRGLGPGRVRRRADGRGRRHRASTATHEDIDPARSRRAGTTSSTDDDEHRRRRRARHARRGHDRRDPRQRRGRRRRRAGARGSSPLRALDDDGHGCDADIADAFDYAGDDGRTASSTPRSAAGRPVRRRATPSTAASEDPVRRRRRQRRRATTTSTPRRIRATSTEPNIVCVGASRRTRRARRLLEPRRPQRRPVRARRGHPLDDDPGGRLVLVAQRHLDGDAARGRPWPPCCSRRDPAFTTDELKDHAARARSTRTDDARRLA